MDFHLLNTITIDSISKDLVRNYHTNLKKKLKIQKRVAFVQKYFISYISNTSDITEILKETATDTSVELPILRRLCLTPSVSRKLESSGGSPYKDLLTSEVSKTQYLLPFTIFYMNHIALMVERECPHFQLILKGSNMIRMVLHLEAIKEGFADDQFLEDLNNLFARSDIDFGISVPEQYFHFVTSLFKAFMKKNRPILETYVRKFVPGHIRAGKYIFTRWFAVDFNILDEDDGKYIYYGENKGNIVNVQSNYIKTDTGCCFSLLRHKIPYMWKGNIMMAELLDLAIVDEKNSTGEAPKKLVPFDLKLLQTEFGNEDIALALKFFENLL